MVTCKGLTASLAAAFMTVSMLTPRLALAERQDARRHYEKATSAFGLAKYDEAAAEYEAAFQVKPEPALLYNAAQAYRLAGKAPRAALLYRNYLRLYGDAANADDARQHLAKLETGVAAPADRLLAPSSVPPTPAGTTPPLVLAHPAASSGGHSSSASPTRGAAGLALVPPSSPPTPSGAPSPTLTRESGAEAPPRSGPGLTSRPVFWIAVGAVVLGGGLALVLSRDGDKDPKPGLGTVVGN